MTKAEIGELSLKVLGIYAFLFSLIAIQYPVSLLHPGLSQTPSGMAMLVSFVPAALLLLFAAFLWLGSKRIRLTSGPEGPSAESASKITPAILQSIAFSVAGIFILIDTLLMMSNLAVELSTGLWRSMWFWTHLSIVLIRTALGLWLLLGAAGLRRFRNRMLESVRPILHKDW